MIVVRRVEERQRQRASRRLSLRTGDPLPTAETGIALRLVELWLAPGEQIELDGQLQVELITYVVTGTLMHALGRRTSALLATGELQRTALGLTKDVLHTQTNPSRSETSHVLQLLVHDPRLVLEPRQEQRRFWQAQRRGLLCAVAAPHADEQQLLSLQSEITVYSSLLDPGQHLVHSLAAAHSGILHVLSGELSVADLILGPGDTAQAHDQRSLAFTARAPSEVLLADVHDLTSF